MKFGSLFSGIGGFDLGLERAGMECAWQVEIDEYCLKVLEKHWPSVSRYTDIRECGRDNLEPVDLICGGFPCQPYSVAGKRRGAEDDRNLWPEFLRIIKELRPTWIIGENVPGIIPMYLDTVLSDLEGEAYSCWTFNIPACAFDAPHRRERIFVVAYTSPTGAGDIVSPIGGQERCSANKGASGLRQEHREISTDRTYSASEDVGYTEKLGRDETPIAISGEYKGSQKPPRGSGSLVAYAEGDLRRTSRDKRPQSFDGSGTGADSDWWTIEPDVGRVAHGIPSRVDRLRSLGNAIVPQVAEFIAQRIMEVS